MQKSRQILCRVNLRNLARAPVQLQNVGPIVRHIVAFFERTIRKKSAKFKIRNS